MVHRLVVCVKYYILMLIVMCACCWIWMFACGWFSCLIYVAGGLFVCDCVYYLSTGFVCLMLAVDCGLIGV